MAMEVNYDSSLVNALKEVVLDCNWQKLGRKDILKKKKCQKLYAEDGEDLILLYVAAKDTFYAMEAVCSHEGGPLEMGDIEDIDGRWMIVCPWHFFEFDIETGQNLMGLSQKTYEIHENGGFIYINCSDNLSFKSVFDSGVSTNQKYFKDVDMLSQQLSNSTLRQDRVLTIEDLAVKILLTPDPKEKARLTIETAQSWNQGKIPLSRHQDNFYKQPPDTPLRLENLTVLQPEKIKRGKGGTLASRIKLIHSLANIEQWAIDLSWDIIARFSAYSITGIQNLPTEFFSDFIKVAADEAKHFTMLDDRLNQLGSYFGALPVHNALWQSACDTKESFLGRLAIVHMVHEARGLDVHPQTQNRFAAQNDKESVDMLDVIFQDEISHVQAGLKWFTYVCENQEPPIDPVTSFHEMVKQYFHGYLKPPFNTEAREIAGMTEEWYLPLVKRKNET